MNRPIRQQKTPGRNASCPCGSWKKFKRCCSPRRAYDPLLDLSSAEQFAAKTVVSVLKGCTFVGYKRQPNFTLMVKAEDGPGEYEGFEIEYV